MIASVAFRNFKALRATSLELQPFNLVIGANGSGKTSLIQALLRLRSLSRLPIRQPDERLPDSAEITFRFKPPHDGLEAILSCVSDTVCDLLQVVPLVSGEGVQDWTGLKTRLSGIRSYLFDHHAMAEPVALANGGELAPNGGNLSAVLEARRTASPEAFALLQDEVLRMFPEYDAMDVADVGYDLFQLRLRLVGEGTWVPADSLSQGTLYGVAIATLACDPVPPEMVCIEEIDRGIHPRLLREIRDLLYQLSYPDASGLKRPAVQVIATTHSPYLLDLFKDYPEEVVIAEKQGRTATFSKLSDRADLVELLGDGSLGDLWFSGILGGVPPET